MLRSPLPLAFGPNSTESGIPWVPSDKKFEDLTPRQQAKSLMDLGVEAMRDRPLVRNVRGRQILSGYQEAHGQNHKFGLSLGVETPSDFIEAFGLSDATVVRLTQDYFSERNIGEYKGLVALVESELEDEFTMPSPTKPEEKSLIMPAWPAVLEDGGFEMTFPRLVGFSEEQRLALQGVILRIMDETTAYNLDFSKPA